MKLLHLLLISTVVLTSCYTEDRIKPAQTKLNSVTVTSYVNSNNNNSNSNNNNNSNTTVTTLYLSNFNYSNSQKVDSNGNGKYSSFVTSISTVFNKTGKFKYSFYVKSNYSSTYSLVGSSGLITIPNNLSYNFSKKFNGDSLSSYMSYTNDYLNFYFTLQDSSGNYIQQSSSYYSGGSYLSLGNTYTETLKADTTIIFTLGNVYTLGEIDKNNNGYAKSFNGISLSLSNGSSTYPQGSNYYLKLYYKPLNSTERKLYGITSTLTTSSSYYYSNYYDAFFTPLVDTLSKGNYTFYVSIFDKNTNNEISQNNQLSFTNFIESNKIDSRIYTLSYIGMTIKDDGDADGFPASYTFKALVKASDSVKVNLSGTLYYTNYGSSSYYTNPLVSSITVVSGDTATFLVTGGTTLSHSYYDLQFGLTELGYSNSIGYWTKSNISKFNAVPFETFAQD